MTNAWLAFNSIFYFCEQILTPDVFKEIKHICTVILGNSSTDISKKELVQTAQGGYYKPQVQCAVFLMIMLLRTCTQYDDVNSWMSVLATYLRT